MICRKSLPVLQEPLVVRLAIYRLFGYRLYGYFLDTYLGIQGVNYVFYIMAAFSAGRFICAAVWAK
ncbi:putative membrane protein [Yersinia pseudotuberculosis IP 31758]|uniref:Putative membrane protein n=1 Tax=Yersinia pseudotuberculosis serotype O:1b (strain IP 31758) TaxID=349747 RepID=A0A0U1R1Q6_YERP3|nr:putative membrane protein [Yersinia pseudotuberculosis IP 31758]